MGSIQVTVFITLDKDRIKIYLRKFVGLATTWKLVLLYWKLFFKELICEYKEFIFWANEAWKLTSDDSCAIHVVSVIGSWKDIKNHAS